MYARMHATIEALKTRANDGTQLAMGKFEEYKSRMGELHVQATTKLQAKRAAVADAVTGRRDATVAALKERGTNAVEYSKQRLAATAQNARAAAVDFAEHPRERTLAAVEAARATTQRVTGVELPTVEQAAASCSEAAVAASALGWRKARCAAGYAWGEASQRLPEGAVTAATWTTEKVVAPAAQLGVGLAAKVDAMAGGRGAAFVAAVAAKVDETTKQSTSVAAEAEKPVNDSADVAVSQ